MKPLRQLALALLIGVLGASLAYGRVMWTRPWWYPIVIPLAEATSCTYFVDNSSTGCGGGGCSDSNNGTSLATAWKTIGTKLTATTLSAGQTACLVGQTTPNTTNGGIWRETYSETGGGSAWGANEVDITAYDITKLPIITGASCYGAASGLCTGSAAVTWHHCASNDALCNNSVNANITNVYEYTRPTAVQGAIYVDDPDVINAATLWPVDATHPSSTFLTWASGLPGAGSTEGTSHYQADMTAGSFYDDGTHLYIWLSDASDPGTHIIEAVTRQSTTGIIKVWSSANTFTKYSYLKLIYAMDDGIDVEGSTNTVNVWFDHITGGGTGAGPATNQGSFYAAVLMAAYGGSQPTGALSSSTVQLTNNVVNWCGSHNCLNVQGTTGAITETNNNIGTSEHSGLDIKCAYNVLIQNDYVHDGWTGTIGVGGSSGGDAQYSQNAYYTEMDWNSCAGGTITWKQDLAYHVNAGFFCNVGSTVNSGARNLTCNDYNTTVVLTPQTTNNCFYTQVLSGTAITRDTENNICETQANGQLGFLWSTGGTSTITEKYNLYYSTTGTFGGNQYGGSTSTTLANWQANCGGSNHCGTGDLWKINPQFSDLAGVATAAKTLRLFNFSPAINAGGTTAGTTSQTLGGTAEVVGGGF